MFENFEKSVCEVFKEAEKECLMLKHEYVGTEHLVLGLLKMSSDAKNILNNYGITYENFLKEVNLCLPASSGETKFKQYTPLLKRIIYSAINEKNVTELDLLYNVLEEGEGVAIRILMALGLDVDLLYNELKNHDKDFSDLEVIKYGKLLNKMVDLNEKVIGRDKEIELVIETLLRKKKSNPLLIGDAGVGKSAIVEELARRIEKGNVPSELIDSKVVMLEMGSLISGTRYRGEFEERLTTILKEVTSNKNIILFIDEIHSMVNAGAAEGAISASDILKPALARGEIKCIGATTKKEYEKYFLKDKALSRRFDPILIKEPNENETFNILVKVRDEYSKYHGVKISNDMLKTLIHLACIYFPNLKNPDKSLELLDSVMTYVKVNNTNTIIKEKELKLYEMEMDKFREIENGNFKAAHHKNVAENKIKRELTLLKNGAKNIVKENDLLEVLEHKNNIVLSSKKIKNLSVLKKDYSSYAIDEIINVLKGDDGPKFISVYNIEDDFSNKLANLFSYEFYNLNSENINTLFNKIKYFPSMIIEVSNRDFGQFEKTFQKIKELHFIEYNEEEISFQNAIFIIKCNEKQLGFNSKVSQTFKTDATLDLKTLQKA